MSWTTQQSEDNAALNALEFSNRQILLPGNGPPPANFMAAEDTIWSDRSVTPAKHYIQEGSGISNNWEPVATASAGSSTNGGVFISDITPTSTGNVGGKTFSSDNLVLDTCIADTDDVTVHVIALTGHTNLKPAVTVEGQAVTLTQDEDQVVWTGSIDIDRAGSAIITATHEDGASFTTSIQDDKGPEVQGAVFAGGYPASQTELKENDAFDIDVATDTDMVEIEVDAFGAAQAQTIPVAAGTTATITIAVADQGNVASSYGARLRARNANGSFGAWFETHSAGTTDGTHVVTLNNLHPVGAIDSIDYPTGQGALKASETATVNHTASDFDAADYDSPTGELAIANTSTFEAAKTVGRQSGGYNVNTDNFRLKLTRTANGAETFLTDVIKIAESTPTITVIEPAARLRSGGNHLDINDNATSAQNHQITVQSNQELFEPPAITAPVGTLQNMMSDTGNAMTFTQDLRVHDDDTRGVFEFGLTQAKNLAGKIVTDFSGDKNYEVGGFVERKITIPAFGNEVDLLVDVADVSKLVVRDKDLANMTYASDFVDAIKAYTTTGPSGVQNPNGDLFHWNDLQAIGNNTTGQAFIVVEELV